MKISLGNPCMNLPIHKKQPCYNLFEVVTTLLQGCYNLVTRLYKVVILFTTLLQGRNPFYNLVTRLQSFLQPCYKVVILLQGCNPFSQPCYKVVVLFTKLY